MQVEIQRRREIFDDLFEIEEAVLRYERYDGVMSEPVRPLSVERGDSVAAPLASGDFVDAKTLIALQWLLTCKNGLAK